MVQANKVQSRTDKKKKNKEKRFGGGLKVFALSVLVFIIGLPIGYGIVGKGSMLDIYKFDTWKHMFDLIFG
ncbi:MAG: DNA-directed RNA polymerase subunit beta [Syntrophales bacterium]|jgi:hypothetical protein|nr:DNA-directed RNA polymerase subunit beta [Syntrophales bacterium]